MFLQLNSADGAGRLGGIGRGGCGAFHGQIFPLGLSLEQAKGGFLKQEASARGKCFRNGVVDGINSSVKNVRKQCTSWNSWRGETGLGGPNEELEAPGR
ncbi:hypothetical protein V6N11_037649 [Hibiscus sabdariffa]|uniref:Uncharacterized protein n=1 Tax=Hibiscus sabdariffa TaxID=183260 RepID=A0ABR2PBW8_9ROSI